MSKPIFDLEDGDFLFSTSGNMGFDSDGNMMIRMSDNMAMNMDSGELHFFHRGMTAKMTIKI